MFEFYEGIMSYCIENGIDQDSSNSTVVAKE